MTKDTIKNKINLYYLLQVYGDSEFRLNAKSARKNDVRAEFFAVGWVFQNKDDAEAVAKRWIQGKRILCVVPWYDERLDIIWNGNSTKSEVSLAKKSIRLEIDTYQLNEKRKAIELECYARGLHHSWLHAKTIPDDMSEKDKETHKYYKPQWDKTFEEIEKNDLRRADFAREEEDNKNVENQTHIDAVRFRFRSANSLIQEPSKVNWIIKPYIDDGSLSLLFGESGCMKTFVAIDIGLCVATGENWHGSNIYKSGPVFYIAGEGFRGLSRRVKAWFLSKKLNSEKVPFFISDRPAQLLDKNSAIEVSHAVDELQEQHGKPVLIIVDTLNRNFGPGDENSTQDMTAFISSIDLYIKSRYGCAVLIVHHSPLNDPGRARGASALRASLDWEYCLKKQSEDSRLLTVTKVKDYDEPPNISFTPRSIQLEGWIDEEGETMTSCVLVKNDGIPSNKSQSKVLPFAQKVAFDCLVKLNKENNKASGAHIDEWRKASYEAGISPTDNQDSKKKAFQRAVKELRNGGRVETKNDYYWVAGHGIGTGQMRDMSPI